MVRGVCVHSVGLMIEADTLAQKIDFSHSKIFDWKTGGISPPACPKSFGVVLNPSMGPSRCESSGSSGGSSGGGGCGG